MRQRLLPLAVVVGAILLGRRLAGGLREGMQSVPERMMSGMQRMLDEMPIGSS